MKSFSHKSLLHILLLAVVAAVLFACGGNGTFSPTVSGTAAPAASISVTKTIKTIQSAGSPWQFGDLLTGISSDTPVTWTVLTTNGGTITSTGLYSPPTLTGSTNLQVTIQVSVTSNPSISATTTFTVTAITAVSLSINATPQWATSPTVAPSIWINGTVGLTAVVTGVSNPVVTWTILNNQNSSQGTITSTGNLTATYTANIVNTGSRPKTRSGSNVTIQASLTGTNQTASVGITLGSINVAVTPSNNPTITEGQTLQFQALSTFNGSSTGVPQAVSWTTYNSNTVSTSGLVTAGFLPGASTISAVNTASTDRGGTNYNVTWPSGITISVVNATTGVPITSVTSATGGPTVPMKAVVNGVPYQIATWSIVPNQSGTASYVGTFNPYMYSTVDSQTISWSPPDAIAGNSVSFIVQAAADSDPNVTVQIPFTVSPPAGSHR